MSGLVLPQIRATFRAVAAAVVPETVALDADGWARMEAEVERALAARPERVRRQLVLFARVVEYLPLLTDRARFSRLAPTPRHRLLKALELSRFLLVRRGVWGLRTLVLLGYYSQPEIQERIGYRAHPDGWSARRAASEPLMDS
ncbi:MAG: hypothetical protein IPK85_07945 [Gemmatimonadetes bacterium]|nr:hypothetical protein [Gemmatimonadota bacterium]